MQMLISDTPTCYDQADFSTVFSQDAAIGAHHAGRYLVYYQEEDTGCLDEKGVVRIP